MKKQIKLFFLIFLFFLFILFPIKKNDEKTIETFSQSVLSYAKEKATKQTQKNLAVFIRFSDSDQNVIHHLDDEKSVSNAQLLLNSDTLIEMNSANGIVKVPSFKKYYERESYGDLSITTEIFPKENGKVISYKDVHPIGYYLKYSESNKIGYTNKEESLKRETELLNNAISYISNMVVLAGLTAEELDPNQDGVIDGLSFIIEGQENLPSYIGFNELLWSHMMNNTGINETILGKQASAYTLLYATDYTQTAGLFSLNYGTYGTIIHEYGHTLGYKDLYRFGNDSSKPVGFYDIMGNTIGSNPQSFLTYYISEYQSRTNWHNPLPVIRETTEQITLYKPKFIDKNEKRAIKIEIDGNTEEFFIVEYHEKLNTYPSHSADQSGIIVYRVNEKNKYLGNTDGSNQGKKDHVYIFRPNETGLGNGEGDLSFATLNSKRKTFGKTIKEANSGFDNETIFFSDGSNSGIAIEVTNETADSITFNVVFPKKEGSGTKEDPYIISNTSTFLYLMSIPTQDKYYKIMNDLDFKDILDYPTLNFEGNLEGNHKTLRNITIKNTSVFDSIGNYQNKTTIENLTLENIKIDSNRGNHIGGFAGTTTNVNIKNVHVKSGSITREGTPLNNIVSIGGFIGSASNTTLIENCSTNASVKAPKNAGGFIGINMNAQIKDSFANGSVSGNENIGGFIGLQYITDTFYHIPQNVYYDFENAPQAVGGFVKDYHNLNVLDASSLAKGIIKISVPKEITVKKNSKVDLPITTAPNTTIQYNVESLDSHIATYHTQIEGINVGETFLYIDIEVGNMKMRLTRKLSVLENNQTITEQEVLAILGLNKKQNYVVGFSLGTNILDIKRKIASDTRIQLKSFKSANHIELQEGIVATGMQFTLFFNNTDYNYTIVIKGDVNGDGVIYATDYVKVKNHIMGKTTLYGAYLMAADINNDGNIYATDYVQIKNHIMEKKSILQTF